jgi:hypothetical protein
MGSKLSRGGEGGVRRLIGRIWASAAIVSTMSGMLSAQSGSYGLSTAVRGAYSSS